MSKTNVFPLRTAAPTSNAAAPTKRKATRSNVVPATPFEVSGKVVQIGETGSVQQWPDTPSDILYYPNVFSRSALFGGTRTKRANPKPGDEIKPGMKVVGQIVEFTSPISSTSQYEVYYRGEILNQQDAEVWMMVMATARRAGLAGQHIQFSLNEWCRALGRPDNDFHSHQALIASMLRLKSATVKIRYRDSNKIEWISMIDKMTVENGRWSFTIDAQVAAMCSQDCTQIDVVRKSVLRTMVSKWMHDFFSTSSPTFTWTLAMLRELSGCTHMEPRKFRAAVADAVEELKCIKGKDGTEFAPVFAPETHIETQIRDGKPCEVLVMVKGSNSLVLEPRKGVEMLELLTATAMQTKVEERAPVVVQASETVQAAPVSTVVATEETHKRTTKNVRYNAYGEVETRSSAEIAAANQRSRVAL